MVTGIDRVEEGCQVPGVDRKTTFSTLKLGTVDVVVRVVVAVVRVAVIVVCVAAAADVILTVAISAVDVPVKVAPPQCPSQF